MLTKNLSWLIHPGTGLGSRVAFAGLWAFLLRLSLRGFDMLKIVVLARILTPHDFGLMGVALLSLALLETFTRLGFSDALVQHKGDIRPYLDTTWTVRILRSLLLFSAVFLLSPLVAGFFGAPEATPVVRVMSLVLLITAVENIGVVYFRKELEFQKRFVQSVTNVIAEVGVSIALALILHSVWALVYGIIAGKVVSVLVSYLLHPYRPRLRFEWDKAKVLFNFGKWMTLSRILSYFVSNLDNLIVGKVIGVAGLGLYRMAYTTSGMMSRELTNTVDSVLFPAYSKLQENTERLREAYLWALNALTLIALPSSVIFLFAAETFTEVVLGDKWLPMVPAFQILIIFGAFRAIAHVSQPMFLGVGRPDLVTKLQLVRFCLIGALIYPMTEVWGLLGAALAVLGTSVIGDSIQVQVANRVAGASLMDFIKVVFYPVLLSLITLLALVLANQAMVLQSGVGQLVWIAGVGGLAFLAALAFCRFALGYTAGGLLTKRMRTVLAR